MCPPRHPTIPLKDTWSLPECLIESTLEYDMLLKYNSLRGIWRIKLPKYNAYNLNKWTSKP